MPVLFHIFVMDELMQSLIANSVTLQRGSTDYVTVFLCTKNLAAHKDIFRLHRVSYIIWMTMCVMEFIIQHGACENHLLNTES